MKHYSIIQRNKSKGLKTWYLRTYDTETRETTFKSLKTDKKHTAAEIMRETINQANETQEQREKRVFDGVSIAGAVVEYLKHYELLNASFHTINGVKSTTKLFMNFCNAYGIKYAKDITPQAITAFFASMETSANTKRKRHQILKTFYKWLLEFYDIEKKNVFSKVKPPRAESSRRFFWTLPQIEKILDATANPQRRLFYALMAFEGLRYFEARGLTWEQVKNDHIDVLGKGRKFSAVPLSDRTKNELIRAGGRQESGKILKGISTNSRENKILQDTCKGLFIDDGTPVHIHRFRHSFGSNLLKEGVNIVSVAKLMRHDNANITLKYYAHVLNEDLTAAINKL